MNATASEPLELTPYSPMWPVAFDIEKGRLTEIFGSDAVNLIEGKLALALSGDQPKLIPLEGASKSAD